MIDGKDDKEDYVAMRVRSMMDLSYLCFICLLLSFSLYNFWKNVQLLLERLATIQIYI